jgi:hypothetical protein
MGAIHTEFYLIIAAVRGSHYAEGFLGSRKIK